MFIENNNENMGYKPNTIGWLTVITVTGDARLNIMKIWNQLHNVDNHLYNLQDQLFCHVKHQPFCGYPVPQDPKNWMFGS